LIRAHEDGFELEQLTGVAISKAWHKVPQQEPVVLEKIDKIPI
jgi:hypothetical protein